MTALLEVEDLRVQFGSGDAIVRAVDGVSLRIEAGETLGIVGESGSGKSVTALSLLRLVPTPPGRIAGGRIAFAGTDLLSLPIERMRAIRGREIAMIFQDPMTSLNPVLTVGRQISEVLELHLGLDSAAARRRTIELFEMVGIPAAATRVGDYPHHFSGGMRQRVMIAMAIACRPKLLVADEPTTALDVTIQAQIIQLLVDLVRQRGLALVLITHDMGVVAQACDEVVVLYAGRVAESNAVDAVFAAPAHPYTQALIACIPRSGQASGSLRGIPGIVPSVASYSSGCRYHPRCSLAQARCGAEAPTLQVRGSHRVACHFAGTQGSPNG
jgi:oligopeptide/dipeptide ABC transporter ATP-binding protein